MSTTAAAVCGLCDDSTDSINWFLNPSFHSPCVDRQTSQNGQEQIKCKFYKEKEVEYCFPSPFLYVASAYLQSGSFAGVPAVLS